MAIVWAHTDRLGVIVNATHRPDPHYSGRTGAWECYTCREPVRPRRDAKPA